MTNSDSSGAVHASDSHHSFLLDIFRIVLCLGVFVYHVTPERCASGPFSVNGFLVMSGFLVGVSVFSGRKFDTEKFYSRRSWRLLPIFAMTMIIAVVSRIVEGTPWPEWNDDAWHNFSLVQLFKYYNVPSWYMIVEIVFLMLVPFFVFLSRVKWRLEFFWIVICAGSIVVFLQTESNGDYSSALYYSPIARAWQFVGGMLVGKFSQEYSIFRWVNGKISKVIVLLLLIIFIVAEILLMILKQSVDLNEWNYTVQFNLLTSAFFMIIIPGLYFIRFHIVGWMSKALVYCAALTYPLYLIHVVARIACELIVGKFWGEVSYCIIAVCTFIVSVVSSCFLLWIDKHIQNWKKS